MARTWTAWIFTSSAQNKSPLQLKVPRRRRFKNVQFSSWSKAEQCRVDLKLNKRKKKGKNLQEKCFRSGCIFCTFGGRSKPCGCRVVPEGGAEHPVVTNLDGGGGRDVSLSLCDIIRGAEVQTCDDRGKMGLFSAPWGELADGLDTHC